jgi:2-polyprenyl-6-methoxyphenol hydroxylase-like FAD-dependent oxidoreductase
MSRTPYSALISGAGIAGPALAYWLLRAGFDVTIVERAPVPRPGGQAVDIRGAARDVVGRMSLLPAIKARGLDERGFAFVDERGKHQASMPVSFMSGEGIVAEIEILRGELSRVVYEATCDEAEYRFNDSIASLAEDDDGVQVTFVNAPPRRFDVVVGADGVHSRVRGLAFGEGESTWIAPLGGYAAYFTLPYRIETEGWFAIHNAPGGRAIGLRPGGPTTTQVMLSFLSPPLGYERESSARQKALLARTFAGVGWEAPRALGAMREVADFYFDLVAQVKMPRWTRGRVALVGDAGYSPSPVTGLGTSLALVGACVLAGELARSDGAYGTAFARYESVMRDYVKQCQELPPGGIQGMLPRTRPAIWMRNLSMRMMTHWPVRNLVAGMFNKADAIELEDYLAAAPSCAAHIARTSSLRINGWSQAPGLRASGGTRAGK